MLTGNDELSALELGEQSQPVVVEDDEVVGGFHTGLGLGAVAEGEAHVLGLVQVHHVGVSVPGVGV